MRNILVLSLLCILFTSAQGLAGNTYCELLKSDLTSKRVDIITELIPLTEEQAEVFWPLYAEYEKALITNLERRDMLTGRLAENYDSLDAKLASGLAEELFDIGESRAQIQRKFYKQIVRELPSPIVARYFQVEFQLNMLSDLQIASQLPQFGDGEAQASEPRSTGGSSMRDR